ncbi:hypothetical protein HAZT_HAZT005526 [Hyalella azteca]|uniref:Anion exchange protein n=1 Tax=Hyalella azteca TaxID=294128 RepID=A0A6A0HC55_HYAAZ|nr:hypothetical protein HAZT_HAZT005526 [Hyalella azteca]
MGPQVRCLIHMGPQVRCLIHMGPQVRCLIHMGPQVRCLIDMGPQVRCLIDMGPQVRCLIHMGPQVRCLIHMGPQVQCLIYMGPQVRCLIHWAQVNTMQFNGTKFEVLRYRGSGRAGMEHRYLAPDNSEIEEKQLVRDLGALMNTQDQRDGKVELLGEVEAPGSVLTAEETGEVPYVILYTWKMITGMVPNFESETFRIETYHNERRGRLCKIPPLRNRSAVRFQSLREGSLFVAGPRLFNVLPKDLREEEFTLETFKRQLDVFLGTIPDQPPLQHNQRREASNSIVHQVRCLIYMGSQVRCLIYMGSQVRCLIYMGPQVRWLIHMSPQVRCFIRMGPQVRCLVLMGPQGGLSHFHENGRAMATLFSDEIFHEVAYKAQKNEHLLAGVDEFLDAVTVLPPGEWDPSIRIEPPALIPSQEQRKKPQKVLVVDEEEEERKMREASGLVRTGRLFGGFINDVKRKAPWYWSDFRDGISMQSVATFFFLYFACLAPIITFGGLLGEATGNRIAAMESLVSGLVCGVVYGLFSGQPLTILGSTGPVLVFESIMYDFCTRAEWDYLSFRLWVGLWCGAILILLVAIDASAMVCYITRFTEENFATLIAFIFIYKAVEKVALIGSKYPMETHVDWEKPCVCDAGEEWNGTVNDWNITSDDCVQSFNGTMVGPGCAHYYPDVFLLSVLLFLGTFLISCTLKDFKGASFFPTKVS